LSEPQLETFLQAMEVLSFEQFARVVAAGEHGDSMYMVLAGEVRARNLIQGRETTLATMGVGEFFGEIALLDHGPRSADVIANHPSVLLKISAASIDRLVTAAPDAAALFLRALSRAIAGRMRGVLKKYQDSIQFVRVASAVRGRQPRPAE
jgi:CRP-like cAMP-binding protein